MASIKRSLSSRVDKAGKSEILLRINIDRTRQQRIKTGIFVTSARFKNEEIVKPRANRKEADELIQIENELVALERFILNLCQQTEPEKLTKDFITESIRRFKNPVDTESEKSQKDIYGLFNEFLAVCGLSEVRIRRYRVIIRTLARYEAYTRKSNPKFKLTLDGISDETLYDLNNFIESEPEIYNIFPELYNDIPTVTPTMRRPIKPQPRGKNTLIMDMKLLRAFFNWAIRKGHTSNYPFSKFPIPSETYGTPFYLTIEERTKLADFDFGRRRKGLSIQRDIFIFQCLIGCRVSDLYRMRRESIIDGAVEYIPTKTKGERPEVVRVPLNPQAVELVRKYKAKSRGPLFPFISSQKYNDCIKEMLRLAGIDRIVTILNPTTGEEEKRPIYEVASSHMARRTFIGNLYKKVKDPNLVGCLSGHKEGSRAFARYRDIDEDMKKELVNLL